MTKTLELGVQGMTCASCVGRVERGLNKVEGVEAVVVNLATERATVTYDPASTSPQALLEKVKDVGYEPVTTTLDLGVTGMTCANCVNRVERALKKVDGVLDASVNLATERATVQYLPSAVSSRAAQGSDPGQRLRRAGSGGRARPQRRRARGQRKRSAGTGALGAVQRGLCRPAAPHRHAADAVDACRDVADGASRRSAMNWIMLALAVPVQFGPGRRFYRQGWAALRHRSPDMNTLVMIGTSAAFFYSLAVTLLPQVFPAGTAHVYYEASAVVITLILLGKYFEAIAKGRSSEAMKKLLGLQVKAARVLRNGTELELPTDEVLVGDVDLGADPARRSPWTAS